MHHWLLSAAVRLAVASPRLFESDLKPGRTLRVSPGAAVGLASSQRPARAHAALKAVSTASSISLGPRNKRALSRICGHDT